MKLLLTCGLVLVLASCVVAEQNCCYGWEDGVGTILGSYGNVGAVANVTSPVYTGSHSLYYPEDPIGGTPQAYVAWVTGVQQDDVITAGFWVYDENAEAEYPKGRIWGHYSTNADITDYKGSAGGGETYSAGPGWTYLEWTWSCDLANAYEGAEAFVLEARIYSSADPLGFEIWVDDVCVTAPDHCAIYFPGGASATENTSWGEVKGLFR